MWALGRCQCAVFRRYGFAQPITPVTLRRKHDVYKRPKCPYTTLGINRTASPEQIREAYLSKAKLYHPDANLNDNTANEKFREVREAYESLTNPLPDSENSTNGGSPRKHHGQDWYQEGYRRPDGSTWDREERSGMSIYNYTKWLIIVNVLIIFFWFDPLNLFEEDYTEWTPPDPNLAVFHARSKHKVDGPSERAKRESAEKALRSKQKLDASSERPKPPSERPKRESTGKALVPLRLRPEGQRGYEAPRTIDGRKRQKEENNTK